VNIKEYEMIIEVGGRTVVDGELINIGYILKIRK